MPTWTGSFNKAGSPTIKFQLGGPLPNSEQEFEGIVDTGFTGFVSMPIVQAFPLGLLLAGTTSVTLADGKSAPLLTATGMVKIGQQSEVGVVILHGSAADILLGMDFLAKFGRVLFIHPNKGLASLMDQKEVDPIIDAALKAQAEAEQKARADAAPKQGPTEAPEREPAEAAPAEPANE